ncbi:MAG: universal stress protein [Myxococcota bacterium]
MQVGKVLVTTDFSEAANAAIGVAHGFAERFGASLSLLHVHEPAPTLQERLLPKGSVRHADAKAHAESRLAALASKLGLENVALHVVMDPSPIEGILKHVDAESVDVVVMATHGHTALERLLVGSVTERVVRHAPCAVLTVKPGRRPLG